MIVIPRDMIVDRWKRNVVDQKTTFNCGGKLSFKLVSYRNRESKLHGGSCCDGGISCSNDCDNYFKICLTRRSGNRCSLGWKETSVLGDDDFNFGGSLGGGTPNPVVYSFPKWEGSFDINIEVKDRDGGIYGGDDYVATLGKNWELPAQQNQALARTHSTTLTSRYTALAIEVRVFCDERYLVPSCEEYCVRTESEERGHYECDYVNGKKICLDGWYGPRCLKKRKDCWARNNATGHYNCDPVTGEIICLSGWRNESSNCTEDLLKASSSLKLAQDKATLPPHSSATKDNIITHKNYATKHQPLKHPTSTIPFNSRHDPEATPAETETGIRIQATKASRYFSSAYNGVLQSQRKETVNLATMNGECRTVLNSAGITVCKSVVVDTGSASLLAGVKHTVTASGGIRSSVVKLEKNANYQVKIITYDVAFYGDVAKWKSKDSEVSNEEICKNIEANCIEHRAKCFNSKEENGGTKTQKFSVVQNESLIVVNREFEVNLTEHSNINDTYSCIRQAILQSADKIEKKTLFKFSKLTRVKTVDKHILTSSTVSSLSTTKTTSYEIPIRTGMPPSRRKIAFNLDMSKLLATAVVVFIVVIVFLLLLIQLKRKQRSLKRVTPISTKGLYNNNNKDKKLNSNNNSSSNSNSSSFSDVSYMEYKVSQQTNLLKTTEKSEIKLIKPRTQSVGNSKRGHSASLLQKEADQLETFFL
eukprot:gene18732-20621_t